MNTFTKSLLIAGAVVTGTLVSAKEKNVNSTQVEVVKKKKAKKANLLKAENRPVSDGSGCNHWIDVTASCGVEYYLCSDNYSNFKELSDAAQYFDKTKC